MFESSYPTCTSIQIFKLHFIYIHFSKPAFSFHFGFLTIPVKVSKRIRSTYLSVNQFTSFDKVDWLWMMTKTKFQDEIYSRFCSNYEAISQQKIILLRTASKFIITSLRISIYQLCIMSIFFVEA